MPETICLQDAQINNNLRIFSVGAEGERGRRIRGLIPGTEFSIIGSPSLQAPVALHLKDFTLTLRNSEADHIVVKKQKQ